MPFMWYIDSVKEWAYMYVHSDLVKPDLVGACCKTRQEGGEAEKARHYA